MSDFGLTKFKDDVQKHNNDMQGSIHWTAPEILSESPDVDLTLADVYSFGKNFLPQYGWTNNSLFLGYYQRYHIMGAAYKRTTLSGNEVMSYIVLIPCSSCSNFGLTHV